MLINLPEEFFIRLLTNPSKQIVSFKNLTRQLNLGMKQKKEARTLLNEMVQSGFLRRLKDDTYILSSKQELVRGKISSHRNGYGFLIPEKKSMSLKRDVFIPARYMSNAMHGDTVLASFERKSENHRTEGRVIKVLQRKNIILVGQFRTEFPSYWVTPYNPKITKEILIPEGSQHRATDGSVVTVEITQFSRGRQDNFKGRVLKVLGFPDDPGIDVQIIVNQHQIPVGFSQAALDEARYVSQEFSATKEQSRTDFRHLTIVTIDGETAKDFDDAIHVEILPNGHFQLGVHIADVSHYVTQNSALDKEAQHRGTSVYFPDQAIPMLPESLSTEICSLKPKQDRLTLSVLIEIDEKGHVCRYCFHESLIRSCERMTYSTVAKILLDHDSQERLHYAALIPDFERMEKLALLLYEKRQRRGSIDFNLPEEELVLNESGVLTNVLKSERNIAHRIIEEFMLLANEVVARSLSEWEHPLLYRVHEPPDLLKIIDFNNIAQGFGYRLGTISSRPNSVKLRTKKRTKKKEHRRKTQPRKREEDELRGLNFKVTSRDYQRLVNQILNKPEERILSYLMLRSMKQACYLSQNQGHFGLASNCYTHFTSPIRRYPDLIVHRILKHRLQTASTPQSQSSKINMSILYELKDLQAIAVQASENERRADEAERELSDLKKLAFMAARLGEEFEGIITHVTQEGIFVELIELFIEGFVQIDTLCEDDYRFRSQPLSLIGKRSGKIFRLGDHVHVCVDRINRLWRRVDFSIVS